MSKSKIEWTDRTWNPVTGCTKVSDGCKNCYAERIFPRVYGNDPIPDYSMEGFKSITGHRLRKFTDIKLHHDRLEQPLHWKKPCMIFVNSMSDLFHEEIPSKFILDCLSIMSHIDCLKHTFQILTKRPIQAKMLFDGNNFELPKNIWFGGSIENQKTADERIPIILQIPAKIIWLSIEPMLENINLELRGRNYGIDYKEWSQSIDWVVVGAESGFKRRHCDLNWVGSIVDQCKRANVPVFVKQLHIDGKLVKDINKFPKYLQIREYPNGTNS